MKHPVLKQEFYSRDTLAVARDLLGAHLCRRTANGEVRRLVVTEVEGSGYRR